MGDAKNDGKNQKLVSLEVQKAALKFLREAGEAGVTRKGLRKGLSVGVKNGRSQRTADRALEVLEEAGAKLDTKTDPRTREKIFVLRKGPKWDEHISKETRLALRVAAMALGHGGNSTLEKQLEALEQLADKNLTDKDRRFFDRLRANIRMTGGVAEQPGNDQLVTLEKLFNSFAAEIPRQVELEYAKAGSSQPRTMIFAPYCFTQDLISGGTYLLGREVGKSPVKQLRISRISAVKVLERPAFHSDVDELERAAKYQIGGWIRADEPELVSLRVKGASWIQAMEEARPDFPEFTLKRKDGFAYITFLANAPEGLIRWILQMGPAAEVLGPESLRTQVANATEEMAAMYR